jgi:hypothetical protein
VPDAVQIIQNRPLGVQACAPAHLSDEEIAESVNRQNPTGIASRWSVCDPGHGDARRVACADDPSRVHVVLSC